MQTCPWSVRDATMTFARSHGRGKHLASAGGGAASAQYGRVKTIPPCSDAQYELT
eukprot:COSAG06_NODE_2486_length_6776_cov_5.224652_4_plen_55_part_00